MGTIGGHGPKECWRSQHGICPLCTDVSRTGRANCSCGWSAARRTISVPAVASDIDAGRRIGGSLFYCIQAPRLGGMVCVRGRTIGELAVKLHKGPGLPSDRVSFRAGFDGEEPVEFEKRFAAMTPSQSRVAIVLNTHYPEIASGWFFNEAIVELLQEAMETIGLFWVAAHRVPSADRVPSAGSWIVPVQSAAALRMDELCMLVDSDVRAAGTLLMWEFCGYGGPYYEENRVVDIIIPTTLVDALANALQERCYRGSIAFERFPDATGTPRRRKTLCSWIWNRESKRAPKGEEGQKQG